MPVTLTRIKMIVNFISAIIPDKLNCDGRGGIVCWADIVGPKYIASRLSTWARAYGDFFKPCAFLEERAASGVKLVSIFPYLGVDDIFYYTLKEVLS